jgi:hypothetical protein
MRSEPPARVQVGRDVPVDARGDAAGDFDEGDSADADSAESDSVDAEGDADDPAADGDSPAGFEWGPSLADAEDKS